MDITLSVGTVFPLKDVFAKYWRSLFKKFFWLVPIVIIGLLLEYLGVVGTNRDGYAAFKAGVGFILFSPAYAAFLATWICLLICWVKGVASLFKPKQKP